MFIRKIYKTVLKSKIDCINQKIETAIQWDEIPSELHPVLTEATNKGRRFRPLLLLVTHSGSGGRWQDVTWLGCAMELLHKASLIHDDLVDGDKFRRGQPTLWNRLGHREALIIGDLLIGLAFECVTRWIGKNDTIASGHILQIFSRTLNQACIGEWLDLRFERIETPATERLKEMTLLKSGALIAASIHLGAITGNASDKRCKILTELGWEIGYIFQTINDLNNLNGIDLASKKSEGQDLALDKKNLVTMTLINNGLDLDTFRTLTQKQKTDALRPATSELVRHIRIASQYIDKLPFGLMRQLFASLVKEYGDNWFWMDEDAHLPVASAG